MNIRKSLIYLFRDTPATSKLLEIQPWHPSNQMAEAYFIAHAPQGNFLSPMMNQGEAAVLYCFVFLFLSLAGSGAWSIDAARRGTES